MIPAHQISPEGEYKSGFTKTDRESWFAGRFLVHGPVQEQVVLPFF
jgi:hypothetical protein